MFVFRGSLPGNATWFAINFQTGPGLASQPGSGGDVLLHLRPDFPTRVIVRSSRVGGTWGQQSTPDSFFPLTPGSPFELMVLLPPQNPSGYSPNTVKIAFNGAHFAEHMLPSTHYPPNMFVTIETEPGGLSIHQIQEFFTPSASPVQPSSYPAAGQGMPVPGASGYPPTQAAAMYPPGAAYPTSGPGYPSGGGYPGASGYPQQQSGGMMGKILGTAAAVPILGGALAAASKTKVGQKVAKKMGVGGVPLAAAAAATAVGGHKASKGFGGIGMGTAAGLGAGALGAYVMAKKAKKLKKGFKFGGHSSSSSSSSSDSD